MSDRIRLYFGPDSTNFEKMEMDIFVYTIDQINKFMDVPPHEIVQFPVIRPGFKKQGAFYHFIRGDVYNWEVIKPR